MTRTHSTGTPSGSGDAPSRRSWLAADSHHAAAGPRDAATDDDVFDAGMDSFPASDPPSWSSLRVGAPAA